MPRTTAELERATAEAEAWLDNLDPATLGPAEDTTDLRAITAALGRRVAAEKDLAAGVRAARAKGRSWGRISMALGVSKQAAVQRYGDPSERPKPTRKVAKRVAKATAARQVKAAGGKVPVVRSNAARAVKRGAVMAAAATKTSGRTRARA